MRALRPLAAAAVALTVLAAPAPARAEEKSDNVRKVRTVRYDGVDESDPFFTSGTDIDFSGRFVYAMQQGPQGGVHVVDARTGKQISFISCPGEQNDVAVVEPGLIALGYHNSTCANDPGGGVRLIDVSNPRRPRFLGSVNDLPGGTHTLTVYPGEPIVYASPGGLANGGGIEQIIDVSNPKEPEVVATFTPSRIGCHDVAFHVTRDIKIAACPGAGETQIWDVSDPLAPRTIGHVINPLIQFHHSVAFTHDGRYMVLGDEAIAGNDCAGGPTGAIWVYDISDPALPTPVSYYGIDRNDTPVGSPDVDRGGWCSAHLFNFVPGTYNLVSSWYSGGMNVLDLSDPASPQEIAFYRDDDTNYWSAYWFGGKIWANDRQRGVLDVFTVKGLKEGKHR